MNIKPLITGIIFFLLAHVITFFQLNGQFMWKWFREHEWALALAGIPISFGVGMIIYALFISYFFNEGISLKTFVSLTLAITLVSIQVLWK